MTKMQRKRALERMGYVFVSGWIEADQAAVIRGEIEGGTERAEAALTASQAARPS